MTGRFRKTYNRPVLGVMLNDSIEGLVSGAGNVQWSKAAGRYMRPTRTRRIDPDSALGKEIAARYLNKDRGIKE